MSLIDLLKKKREEIASRRPRDNLARLRDGENFLRILPNPKDPNADFSQAFGMHYVKSETEDGKSSNTAYICTAAIYGEECPICTMVIEAKARWKDNKKMEEIVGQMRSTPRYLVNGILSDKETIDKDNKVEIVELPQTVFDDICAKIIEEQMDEIGNPLDTDAGYSFLIKRTGKGRDTKYEVGVRRKTTKCKLTTDLLSQAQDLAAYVAQRDESKLLSVQRIVSRTTGIPLASGSTTAMIGGKADLAKLDAPEEKAPSIIDDAKLETNYEPQQDDDAPFDIDEETKEPPKAKAKKPKKDEVEKAYQDDLAMLDDLDI